MFLFLGYFIAVCLSVLFFFIFLYIYNGVSIVREHDFSLGLHARIEGDLHRVFLQRLPIFEVDGMRIAANKPLWMKSYWTEVRLTRDKDGQKDTVPPEGSVIKMNFNNDPALASSYREEKDKAQLWYGRVEARPNELLKEAGVEFWILVSMPKKNNSEPTTFVKTELRRGYELPRASISVRTNPTMVKREL